MPPPIDRLSALDATFLALDEPRAPLHVGWTMRFDGPAPPLAQLRRHLDARLAHVPRFRRRVVVPPLGLGDPRWSDDPGFDIAAHVHHVTAPAPGGAAELRALAGTLLSTPLDRSRALWRLYLVDGLQGGFAIVGQAHHALVDGIAAIEVALLLFGPEAGDDAAQTWRPAPSPGTAAGARAALGARAAGTWEAARSAALAAGRPPATAALRQTAGALEALTRRTAPTSLERSASPRRVVAFAQAGLDGVRAAGRRHQATVNDVLLAACTLALGRALRRRGEQPAEIKVLVPVNTRPGSGAGGAANRISFMAVDLPVAQTDPVRVLRAIRDRTSAAKREGAAGPLDAIARAADLLPAAGARVVARAAWRTLSFTTIVSNVPGPPVELSLLGRPLRAVFPAVPVPPGHGLTIGCVSYDGRLHAGLYADPVVVPDVRELAHDLEAALDVLRVEAPRAPTPWRAKARARRRAAPAQPAASR